MELMRQEIIAELFHKLACDGVGLSLSAPNNFGKSRLLRQLASENTNANLKLIYVDCNLLADYSAPALFALILRSLNNASQTAASFTPFHLNSATTPFEASHALLTAFDNFFANFAGRLVLILDEFDQPLQALPDNVLLQLRGLHDNYSHRLSYLIATNLPLLAINHPQNEGITEFLELFDTTRQLHLPPLTAPESDKLASAVAKTYQLAAPSAAQLGEIYRLAGGQPVLTRLVSRELLAGGSSAAGDLLALEPEIQLECRRLWHSLAATERQALLQQLEGITSLSADPRLGSLERRGLIVKTADNQPRIFAALFAAFVRAELELVPADKPAVAAANPANLNSITYDLRREVVSFEAGKRIVALNGNAARLFKYLFVRRHEPWCTKDELISHIWGNAAYSSENLDRLVSDLRQLIGDDEKQIIRTIPRRGLKLEGVEEWQN